MKKLFENVEGNKFRLLSESTEPKHELVESGLKKVFSNADGDISYRRIENVGLGYIKDVSEAQRVALQTARRLSESFGFKDDENSEKFVKENDVEQEPYSPGAAKEEKREVQIGKEIIEAINEPYNMGTSQGEARKKVIALAEELIKMHGSL